METLTATNAHILGFIENDGLGAKRAHCVCGWTGDWTDEGDAAREHEAHAATTPVQP